MHYANGDNGYVFYNTVAVPFLMDMNSAYQNKTEKTGSTVNHNGFESLLKLVSLFRLYLYKFVY
jgi:hypothetical protein